MIDRLPTPTADVFPFPSDSGRGQVADFEQLRARLTRLLDQVRENGFNGAEAERLSERAGDVINALDDVEDADPELHAANLDLRELAHEAFRRVQIHRDTALVDELLEQTSKDDPAPAWTALDPLARLPKAQRSQYVQSFKGRAGSALNSHDYRATLREKVAKSDRLLLHGDLDGRPSIVVTDAQLRDLSDEALRVLVEANEPPRVFERSGELVQVRRDENGRPRIERMGEAHLRGRLCRVANFVRLTKDGHLPAIPPRELIGDLETRGTWGVPALKGIVEAPFLTKNGEIIERPGYHAETALILSPLPGLEVPAISKSPSAAEVADALALIDDLLGDFPFADVASRANAIGCLLTPILRPAIDGSVPLALVDAPKPGTGKGLFANVVAIVATGRDAELTVPPTSKDEWKKLLLSMFAGGRVIVVLDEVEELRSVALSSALTNGYVSDRLLGTNEELTVEQRATWIACGNNIQPRGDLTRRTYTIRLDAGTSRPHERDGFKYADLRKHTLNTRGALLAALLTLARAWVVAGRPSAEVPPFGSFEAWAATTGGVLLNAGVDAFLSNLRQSHIEKNDDDAEWERFLRALLAYFDDEPFSTRDVEYAITGDMASALIEALPGELADTIGRPGVSFARRLGKAFSKRKGTPFGLHDVRVEQAGEDSRSGAVRWQIAAAGLQVSQVSLHTPVSGKK